MHVAGARHLRVIFSIVFVVIAFRALAQTPVSQEPLEPTAANLARVVDPLMQEWITRRAGPGAVVIVVTRNGPVFARGYGFSDVGARKPFTVDTTLVRPGSISKLFTGIAVMQLVEAGKLDLDRDVSDYIEFAIPTPQGGVPVTLRRLLTHRAGFEEHVKGLFSRSREPEPLGRWLSKGVPRRIFPAGDVEAYSNYGFALAGHIVERVSSEPYASYVQRHILDPLGMTHSTFSQPLPDHLSPLMAKGHPLGGGPPLVFETVLTPAGALSATGADIGRFMRALLNGGELDGVRILPKARLDEMMTPGTSTPAGYVGLAFLGRKVAGHDSIGHDGATMAFFSDLKLFPEQGVGIFVSRNGMGQITTVTDIPDPATAIAERFLPNAPVTVDARIPASEAGVEGIYQMSRRAESSLVRLSSLVSQRVIKVDDAGNGGLFSAIWPFGAGDRLRHVGSNVYEGPSRTRLAFVDRAGSESYVATPAIWLQRVPLFLDVRWIAPAFALSAVIVVLTLLAWPIAALRRRWRKRRWSKDASERRGFLAVRIVLLIDAAVIVAAAVFFATSIDLTILSDDLDPMLLAMYGFAWLGVFGAILALRVAVTFWRNAAGSRWSRVHHSLIAASSVMIAWFFVTFGIAGTTLIY